MTNYIPESTLVSVTPAVIGAGNGLNHLSGLIISTQTVVPNQTVRSYGSATAVGNDFGTNSAEYAMAQAYFAGTSIAPVGPNTLYVAGHSGGTGITVSYLNAIASQANFQGITSTYEISAAERQVIAQWVSQSKQYWFVAWDQDTPELSQGDTTSFGAWLKSNALDGTTPLYDTTPVSAAAAIGWMASLDFDVANGRSTLAYRNNSYVTPAVADGTTAANLLANGYNFYGQYPSGNGFQNGSVSGAFLWADSYVNQIWLNTNLQNALASLLQNTGNIPFNAQGDSLISAALQDTINQALSFGAIRAGVTLSTPQSQQVNALAGNTTAAQTLQSRGWYLIPGASIATPSVRQARGPIRPQLIYTDGQSVQTINMISTEVQ